MGKLRVERRGYVKRNGVEVKPTTFEIRDRGLLGRGPAVIPPLKGDILGKGFFGFPEEKQHVILERATQRYGERSIQGRLQALSTLNMNINPDISKDAEDLRHWVATNFDGKKKITDG